MSNQIKYALYARKSSSDENRQIQSIEDQLERMTEVAENLGLNVVESYSESRSAKIPNKRHEFNKMIEAINSGRVDGILVWSLSRLARNPLESGIIQQLLHEEKIKVIQTIDKRYLPEDNAIIFSVESGMHSEFSRELKKLVKRGMRKKIREGGIAGLAPEGYRNDRDLKIIIPDQDRFPLIRKAFDMYLTGDFSVTEVKEALDSWGYTTIKRKKRGGGPLTRSAIYHMFTNIRYVGLIPNPDDPTLPFKGIHQPMITEDEFFRIQSLLQNKGKGRNVSKRTFPLKGLLHCGECGCSITAESHAKRLKSGEINYHVYYHCTKKRVCSQKGVTEKQLYTLIDNESMRYKIPSELYDWGMKAVKSIAKKELVERELIKESSLASIEEIQKRLSRYMDLLERGIITEENFKLKEKELSEELYKRKQAQFDNDNNHKNWFEVVGKTLALLNTDGDTLSDTISDKKERLRAIGYNHVLIDQELAMKYYPWVEPILDGIDGYKSAQQIVRTNTQQIKKAPNGADLSNWYTRQDSNLWPSAPQADALSS